MKGKKKIMSSIKISQEQLASLAEYMREEDSSELSIQPLARTSQHERFPLSFAQQRLWFLDQLQHNSPAYNITVSYRLKGELKLSILEQCIGEIVRRHEVLRTTFKTIDGQPVQVIASDLTPKCVVEDLEPLPVQQREQEMVRRATAEAQEPFNLVDGPLFRVRVFRLESQEHVLVFTLQHIISDGWSLGILLRELATLYDAYVQGRPSPLTDQPLQYVDFAYWQRERLQGEVLEAELDYWRQQLADAPPVLELPTDRPRPAVQTFQGGYHSFVLSPTLSQAVKTLGRQESCTLFQTLLAAFQIVLSRYTGQHDLVVGSPVANRNQVELENMMGFFTNTLVLRSDLSGNPTFLEVLDRVREMTADAYSHQELPFEKLLDELQTRRDLSYNPLVQVLFALQNSSDSDLKLTGLNVSPLHFSNGTTKFDLSLELAETEAGLAGNIQYSLDLFDEETIARYAGHFQSVLEALVATPQKRIRDIVMLTAWEQQRVLGAWNATTADYNYHQAIYHFFEAQVELTPDATAIDFEGQRLTYRDLNEQANQLAHFLQEQGIGPERSVGICVERSLEMPVGLLGILKAGGICVPLDPEYPRERLTFMLKDAHVSILLTQQRLLELLPEHALPVVCLDTAWETIAQYPREDPHSTITAENVAYIIYTSGSTGTPKGVLLTHRSISNRICWGQASYPLTEDDRVLQEASFSFDFAIWEFFGPLAVGARVILARPGGQRDIDYLLERVIAQKITVLHLIPSLLRVFLEQPGIERCTSVRHVYGGAEALPFDLWQRFTERMTAQFHNVYGPTEATIDSTCWTGEGENGEQRVSIGRPISNVQLYLLDQYGQLVPVGVPGEVYLTGAGLARGYLDRPDITAERFVPHPFSQKPGERLYRTGDMARYLSDGQLEYVGRADHQVKVRGFRIEPGEIEMILKSHPHIRNSVVMVREDRPGEKQLVAYLVPEDESTTPISELRSFLQEKLPDYMLPTRFLFLERLPLTPHGKIDLKILPSPEAERPELAKSYVAPGTPAEELLVHIWGQVLGIEHIGIHDNFFELGGDSIRSIQIVARAKVAGLHFSVQQLFRHQTIAELATISGVALESFEILPQTEPFDLLSAADRQLLPADIVDAYPLTALQTGMLYHMELTKDLSGAPDYHNVDSYYYRLPFDLAAFQQAVDFVVQRHPVLRTSFDMTSFSEPLQLVHRQAKLVVQAVDIRQYMPTEQERIIKQFVEEERGTYFDMSYPQLLRFHLHRRTDDAFQFTLTEFHPILDGWSIHSILAAIFKNYLVLLKHEELKEEEPLTTSFRDFVALEKTTLQSETCRQYWAGVLGDYERLQLPAWTLSDEQIERPRYNKIAFPIPLNVSQGLQSLARSLNVSLKHVLLAVHTRVLNVLSGQIDIVTGMLSHGRPEVMDGERVAGLFLNVLPLRLNIADGSWQDLIRQIFAAECAVLPYRRYPLAEMQHRWGGRTPLFNTAFSYFDFYVFRDIFSSGEIEDLDFGVTSPNSGYILDALFFAPRQASDSIVFELVYETARLGEHDARCVGEYYSSVMQAMVDHSQERYRQNSLLSVADTKKLLTEWNAPTVVSSESKLVFKLFEQQVERTPDAVAVIFEQERLTYRQLNMQANQLAHYLQRCHAVAPQALVGLCVERGLPMLVGMLGILKAGGAYVPLDPAYPSERLAFMLADTQMSALLTQQHLIEKLPEHAAAVVCLDRDWPAISQEDSANLASQVLPQNLAYTIYTSGSTGKPKGVLIPHQALTNYVEAAAHVYAITPDDCVLQFASISFDASVEEIYPCLTRGATLVLRTESMLDSVQTFMQRCEDQGITCLSLPTAYWHEITARMSDEVLLPSCLRLVIIGGEAAHPQQLALWQRFSHGIRLINTYGPTETTVVSTMHEVEPDGSVALPKIPIGRPIANSQAYILDASQQLVPIGIPGELYTGGIGLAHGYLNRPELTAERFVPHPWSQTSGERLYRTGDVARYLPDGTLEYLGRVDQQVKVRGFRIELGEIEAVLSQHPQVETSIVQVHEGTNADKSLVAYVVMQEELETKQWRSYLRQHLPEYMVPSAFVRLSALPLTANGKLDRHALPAPDQRRVSGAYVAPRTPLEEQLCQIWAQVLEVERVGIEDNFFDLGGHSLKATQIGSRMRQAVGVNISLRSLFDDPTIAGLVRVIEQMQEDNVAEDHSTIQSYSAETQQEQLISYLEDLSDEEIQSLLETADLVASNGNE